MTISETIAAVATPPGRGGIAVIRISGSLVKQMTFKLIGKNLKPRYATACTFKDAKGEAIDQGIALFFIGPQSFTGEDVLELHCHGGVAVVDCLMKYIFSLGARSARPGEFSERAFLNNKIDLAQAEAIADLIDATSEQAARASLRALQGEFSKKINEIVNDLIQLRTYVEAAIDFAEEEINFLNNQHIEQDLKIIIEKIENIQNSAVQGHLLQDGITIVIVGKPNAGKSSLLNQLSGRDIAIVTDIPGTTRDVLREQIILDGMPIQIIDTAGLRESQDVIEQEGIRRAHEEIKQADLILCVVDVQDQEEVLSIERLLNNIIPSIPIIFIRNKIDLIEERPNFYKKDNKIMISLSAKIGTGINLLKQCIKETVGLKNQTEGVFSARRRHIDAIRRTLDLLQVSQQQLQNFHASELLAEDLRHAQQTLNEITGEFTSDDLLGKIFSSFCIGK